MKVRDVESDPQNDELIRNICWIQKENITTYFPYFFFLNRTILVFFSHGCPHLVTRAPDLCLVLRTEPSGRVGSTVRGSGQGPSGTGLTLKLCSLSLVRWICKLSSFNQTSPQKMSKQTKVFPQEIYRTKYQQ